MFGRAVIKPKKQRGFTLVELLVAIAILGVIGPLLGMAIYQTINMNAMAGNHMTAVKQVESAVYWISHDAQMAQTIQTDGGSGFPLILTWVEWDNTSNSITYTVQDSELKREYSINGTGPISTVVAQYINNGSEATNCQFDDGILTFQITSSVGGFRPTNETRVREIVPKPQ